MQRLHALAIGELRVVGSFATQEAIVFPMGRKRSRGRVRREVLLCDQADACSGRVSGGALRVGQPLRKVRRRTSASLIISAERLRLGERTA